MERHDLEETARAVRREVLERSYRTGLGHLGGTFSVVEILVALYFSGLIRQRSASEETGPRDRLLLSKGHACLALYSILNILEVLPDEAFNSFGLDGGLGAQLDTGVPGVHWNTGSLGHAIGVGAGIALGEKLGGSEGRVFALLGDAEFSEGSVWEAMTFASEHQLSGFVTIVDRNRLSVTSSLDENGVFANFQQKVEAFNWAYLECDGHDFSELQHSLEVAVAGDKPALLVANTLKGKGVSFMEQNVKWHHGVPSEEEYSLAASELR